MTLANNPIRTVSLRNLAAHKVRLLLTVISVVLGTAFIAGSFVFTDTLQRTFDKIVATSDDGIDAQISARKSVSPGVPIALADSLRTTPGVKTVQLNASAPVVVLGPNGKKLRTGGAGSVGSLFAPSQDQIGAPLTFSSGGAPNGATQVAINEDAAIDAHLRVGDTLRVITLSKGPLEVTLSGIYHLDVGTGGYVGLLFSQSRGLQLFSDGAHVDSISLAAHHGMSQQALADAVRGKLTADLQVKTGDQVRHDDRNEVARALSFINYFLLAFGAIALLVGTFIIYNTFSMIVAQRLRELAMLRAIGADRKQIRRSVLFEAGLIGLVGSLLGVGAGVGLAYGLRVILDAAHVGLPSGGLVLSARTVVVALVVGTGVTLISAYSPARRAARVSPVAAMREEFASTSNASLRRRNTIGFICVAVGVAATVGGALSSGGQAASLTGLGLLGVASGVLLLAPALSRLVIAALAQVLARPFGAVGQLARTNSVRNPRRTAATGFALTLGLMLVSGIAVVGASTKASVSGIVDNDVRADYILTGGDFGVPIDAAATATKVNGVASLTTIASLPTTIDHVNSEGSGVDGPLAAIVRIRMVAGGGEPTGHNMLASKSEAASKHWTVGSRVRMSTPGGAGVDETVIGIYSDNPLLGPWLASGDTYRTLTPVDSRVDVVALVHAAPGADLAAMRSHLESATDPYYVVDVQNRAEFKGSQAAQVNGLLGVLYGLLGIAIVIAILGIVNTLALSVVERRREIGMLRAVGLQRAQVRRTIYVESALIATFGAILGIVIGLGFGVLFTRTLREQGLKTLDVPWAQAVGFLAAAGVVGVLAAIWPAARAARTRPLAVIAEA